MHAELTKIQNIIDDANIMKLYQVKFFNFLILIFAKLTISMSQIVFSFGYFFLPTLS